MLCASVSYFIFVHYQGRLNTTERSYKRSALMWINIYGLKKSSRKQNQNQNTKYCKMEYFNCCCNGGVHPKITNSDEIMAGEVIKTPSLCKINKATIKKKLVVVAPHTVCQSLLFGPSGESKTLLILVVSPEKHKCVLLNLYTKNCLQSYPGVCL